MLWLQAPPWGRWALAVALVAIATWTELRPEPTVEHLFTTRQVAAGEQITLDNSVFRPVPRGLLDPVDIGVVARRDIEAGSPVLAADIDRVERSVPTGWWLVTADLPPGATRGDRVKLVLMDTGATIDGVVAAANGEDGFGMVAGAVAVPPASAGEAATAVSSGRAVILVSSG